MVLKEIQKKSPQNNKSHHEVIAELLFMELEKQRLVSTSEFESCRFFAGSAMGQIVGLSRFRFPRELAGLLGYMSRRKSWD